VLGAEPEAEAPVLTLRLFKAEHKRGARVLRLGAGVDPRAVLKELGEVKRVGLIADESNRSNAARVAVSLAKATSVSRLTVTRGVNGRGAKDMGVLPNVSAGYAAVTPPGKCGRDLLEAAAAGAVTGLLCLGPNPSLEAAGELLQRALGRARAVIAIDTRPGVVARAATVLIPGHAFFEKAGTVTNLEGRVQRIRPALPTAPAAPAETNVLSSIATQLGAAGWDKADPVAVNHALRQALPAYAAAGTGGRAAWAVEAAA
jgi:predicted molibdopterin-dependent oxidoreductase YjgC